MQKKKKKKKYGRYEQSFGYWQNNQNKSGDPKNKTTFYGFGKTQNINDMIQKKQFTDVKFVFFTRNIIPQYICSIYSIKFISRNKVFNHFKKRCWKNKSLVSPVIRDMHFVEPLIIKSLIIPDQI